MGTVFEDPGATATDNIDGPVAVSQSGTVSDEQELIQLPTQRLTVPVIHLLLTVL